jgi:S-methylmethionine-dependent homocysteine/selenocysteine methylase
MAKYRSHLPQASDRLFLTDGGIETTLIFHEGLTLPEFAAFDLLKDGAGYEVLRKYFRTYASLAKKHEAGLILESPTWRASKDWGAKLGYSANAVADANRKAIQLMTEIRSEFEDDKTTVVISGCVGPRGDGYIPANAMTGDEAQAYHAHQIDTFRETAADMITAITMNYVEEALGVARAAKSAGMPVVISFTVETDGRLPAGQSLKEAIAAVDDATSAAPAYYMINCAHPTHFAAVVGSGEPWLLRIRGLRTNASAKSHAELNDSVELDIGDPAELARQHRDLLKSLLRVNVLGGCCGTDHRHVDEIFKACVARS